MISWHQAAKTQSSQTEMLRKLLILDMIGENEQRRDVWECLVPSGKIEKSESDKVQSMYQAPNLTYIFIFPTTSKFQSMDK